MRRFSTLLAFLAVFTIGSIAFTLLRNLGDPERREGTKSEFPLPQADMFMSKVRFADTQQGNRVWLIESENARLFKDKSRAEFETVHITFYGKDGREMHLYSERAELDTTSRDMAAFGKVRGRSSDGLEFFTSSLRYDYDKREVSTDAPVRIVTSGYETEGVGMIVDVDEERIRLLNRVRLKGNE